MFIISLDEVIMEEQDTPNIVLVPEAPNNVITLQETQNLYLECKVSNWTKQDYYVQWIKNDGYVISDNGQLFIESVLHKQHEGTYTCAVAHKRQNYQIFHKKVYITITSEFFLDNPWG